MAHLISDVFKTIGQPVITYIQRDEGRLDQALNSALNESGQLCLVTGPSKTGKTTLYMKVLQDRGEIPLIVRCDSSLTCENLWIRALEGVNFERAETRTKSKSVNLDGSVNLESKIGWSWLADVTGKLRGSINGGVSEAEVRKRVLSDPGPDLLIPILKETNYVLVIEDFHYMNDGERILLFQQWKRFIDNEVSVIVLGTTHRAVDIANSNKDLIGRVRQIDIKQWSIEDLTSICRIGFDYIGLKCNESVYRRIANEAVGLPIIVQQTCLELFDYIGISEIFEAKKRKPLFKESDAEMAMHLVATNRYSQFKSYYDTLIKGPREKARKHKTYELIIGSFTLDPIKFDLSRTEIDQRVALLCVGGQVPPAASMNSTFGALKNFQERRNFQLLEWQPNEEILYIIEPSFLFYVRWRTSKANAGKQLDFLEILIRGKLHENNSRPDLLLKFPFWGKRREGGEGD